MTSAHPNPNPARRPKRILLLLLAAFGVAAAIFVIFILFPLLRDMRPLVVTLDNRSGAQLLSVDLFLDGQESRYAYERKIPSGESRSIRPELEVQGAGALVLEAVDSEGRTYRDTICGYTESLSGELTAVLGADGRMTVQGECR
ncbi:hypothetical protein [Saccharibacillus qingshengii]|uniref:hypothetical protein n=1 Tax=Saccharibacillus qingshengii TaxID=1763540 RepID=UPI00155409D9|nr:hypothetical protein [Saccharibacillus qingshengii]